MAPKCFICGYYDSKKMSLFRIPNRNDEYSDRANVWLKLLDATEENVQKIRICSQHFLNSNLTYSSKHDLNTHNFASCREAFERR